DTAYGSLMAGMALASARLGVVHGLAHPLGVRYDIPHGLVCGVLLPAAIRLNYAHAKDKYDLLSHIAGKPLAAYATELLVKVGMPTDLRAYRIPESDLPAIVADAMPSGSLKANAKKVTDEDVVWMLRQVV
ncbi:MAG: iron-containing alcohol dehydrogenase, partial [Planctomycetes bacterium]|nr:iron-containing alcohol dehydrogenase [Planctomycetota bacterium]